MTMEMNPVIGIVGLGYVGLPLAVEFGKHYQTVGFDINHARVAELQSGKDSTLECEPEELKAATKLEYSTELASLAKCNVYIVTVPTPIDKHKRPDLFPLVSASQMLGEVVKKNDIIIYESTVYPGATEEVCIPEVEAKSGLVFNQDFFAGYSPERINPGDKVNRLTTIVKITSGSTPEIADYVDALYNTIIEAGTHKASSIKVAEAAKVIENTQRDVNIALVNELALIFNRLDIDTLDVLEAAGTKWNFLPFRPGLVGGHCIGVDPYYLTHKAQETGYLPQIIPAARMINESMSEHVADSVIKLMARSGLNPVGGRILILGFAFKENCPDLRNTRVIDIYNRLQEYNANVDIYDPWVDPEEAQHEYGIKLTPEIHQGDYDAIILAVAHDEFAKDGAEAVRVYGKPGAVLYDVKHIFPAKDVDERL